MMTLESTNETDTHLTTTNNIDLGCQQSPDKCDMCHNPFGKHPKEPFTYRKYYVRGHQLCQFCQPFLRNPATCRTCFKTFWSSTQFFRDHLPFHPSHDKPAYTECPLCHLNWSDLPSSKDHPIIAAPNINSTQHSTQHNTQHSTQHSTPIIRKKNQYTTELILPEIFTNTRAQDHHVRNCLINYLINPDNFPTSHLIFPDQLAEIFPYLADNFEEVLTNLDIDTDQYQLQLRSHQNSLRRLKRKRNLRDISQKPIIPFSTTQNNPFSTTQNNPFSTTQTNPFSTTQTNPSTDHNPFVFKELFQELDEISQTIQHVSPNQRFYESDDVMDLLEGKMKRLRVH